MLLRRKASAPKAAANRNSQLLNASRERDNRLIAAIFGSTRLAARGGRLTSMRNNNTMLVRYDC
jgi:hypothetical protein